MRGWMAGAALAAVGLLGTAGAQSRELTFPQRPARPPAEEGWVVVELPGGYMRYQADGDAGPPGQIGPGRAGRPVDREEGAVIIVPSPPAPPPEPPTALPPGGRPVSGEESGTEAEECPPSDGDGPAICPRPEAAARPCRGEHDRLAQRLVELRGVYLDPASAALVLEAMERPLGTHLSLSLFGLPTPPVQGDTTLLSAVTWDLETQFRLRELARCQQRAQR